MKEERKLILKLGQMITDRVGVKVTVEDPEYWGLAEVLTDEMAEVCLSMKVRKPMTLEQIARKSGKDPERVQTSAGHTAYDGRRSPSYIRSCRSRTFHPATFAHVLDLCRIFGQSVPVSLVF